MNNERQVDKQREAMLKEVMAADFMLTELNLYLNTHPNCRNAMELYNTTLKQYMTLKQRFEQMYGPLTPRYPYTRPPWPWIADPWPWNAIMRFIQEGGM